MSWILVPFSRPERLGNIQDNFARQIRAEKKLCIVENGDARGVCKAQGFEPDLLLSSNKAHPSAARNVGLEALRELGEDTHFCCMDDDDLYGPLYQQEHLNFAARNRITGKLPHWTFFESVGKLWLFNREQEAGKKVAWVHGATVGGFARDVVDFPVVPIGEELHLCDEHRKRGGDIVSTGVSNFVYMRSLDERNHTYQATPTGYADTHGPWFEEHPFDLSLMLADDPPRGVRKNYLQV